MPSKRPGLTSKRFDAAVAAFLCATVVLLYRRVLDNPIFGDSIYTLKEEILRLKVRDLNLFALRWIPYDTFNWIYELFGRDWYWQNLCNVLIHAAATAALYFFYRALFAAVNGSDEDAGTIPDSRGHALLAAAFFGLNPVCVYAVAYLVQRSVLLATLFSILSLTVFLRAIALRKPGLYAVSCLCYFAAVHSKEHVVMLPALMLLLFVLTRRPAGQSSWLAGFKEMAPALTVNAAIALQVAWRLNSGTLFNTYEPNARVILHAAEAAGQTPSGDIGILNAISQGFLFFRYLFHSLVPWTGTMSIDVLLPFPTSYWSSPFTAGFILYLAVPALAWALLRRGGKSGLCGFALAAPWFLYWTEFTAARVSEQFVLYRAYAWAPWLFAAVPAAAEALSRLPALGRKGAFFALSSVLAVSGAATHALLPTFDSPSAAWADAAAKINDLQNVAYKAYRVYYFLGQSLFYENKMDDALAAYEKAVALRPEIPEAYQNIGYVHVQRKDYENARRAYETQLRYHPGSAEALLNLGNVATLTKDYEAAEDYLKRSIQADPAFAKARYNLGLLRARLGRDDEAIADYDEAAKLAGNDALAADALYQAGMLFLKKNDPGDAVKRFKAALKIDQEHSKTKKVKAMMESKLGRTLF